MHYEIFSEPTSDFVYPEDEPTINNEYREASMRYLQIMSTALEFITTNRSPHVASWAIAYALGLPCADGVSLSDRAVELGVSVTALSKQGTAFKRMTGIDESSYQYHIKKKDNE